MDDLYEHFMEHRYSGEPMSVTQFIQSHYFDNVHESADPVKHAKLPLRQSGLSFNQVFHTPVEAFNLGCIAMDGSNDQNPISKCMLPQCDQFSVFQPPKYA